MLCKFGTYVQVASDPIFHFGKLTQQKGKINVHQDGAVKLDKKGKLGPNEEKVDADDEKEKLGNNEENVDYKQEILEKLGDKKEKLANEQKLDDKKEKVATKKLLAEKLDKKEDLVHEYSRIPLDLHLIASNEALLPLEVS